MRVRILAATFFLAAWATGASAQQTYGGYECTDDCTGHRAGYEWAEQNNISSEEDCGGNSQSFEEGCKAYVEDPYRGPELDDDGEEVPKE